MIEAKTILFLTSFHMKAKCEHGKIGVGINIVAIIAITLQAVIAGVLLCSISELQNTTIIETRECLQPNLL
jgi:hypothetical protein